MIYVVMLVAVVIGCWAPLLGFLLFLFGLFAIPAFILVVGAAFAHGLWQETSKETRVARTAVTFVLAPLATFAALVLLAPMLWLGTWLGNETLLWAYHERYEAIIYKVQHTVAPLSGVSAWQHEGSIT